MRKLYEQWGDRVHFVDILVRQAHPGPGARPYYRFEDKMKDAEAYKQGEAIAWTVVVDDLQGTVHQVYGALSDPTYLIDIDGRVSYYNMWNGPATLHKAIGRLLAQGGRGVVNGGLERAPHLLPAMTDGWRGLKRGLPQSFTELMVAAPGVPLAVWLGYQMRAWLAPLTLRAKPLPMPVKIGLAIGSVALISSLTRARRPRKSLLQRLFA